MDATATATWVLVGVSLLSAGFIGWQLIDATRARNAQTTFLRRQETMRVYVSGRAGQGGSGVELPRDSDPDAVAALIEKAKTDELSRRAIRDYLNYWESIATGARFGVLDRDMLAAQVGPKLEHIWTSYSPYIQWIRSTEVPPTFMVELEGLLREWRKASMSVA
ncbi:DUF4760 domain-containing protein [Humibacter ginsenosidimutans]|uniref:DUF4760 domain-containing protein n=1 Tax=Humibacter ginsenosidimutans TaxID=2599293 RepID=A0A5B8M5W4_9MICO|nr:DUF4760 domain-containing protein [Humibacter ginsenosidimutans]QDZ15195.1 DUF4760 domain-containing protein [Humibacter ginsenosidimutans]